MHDRKKLATIRSSTAPRPFDEPVYVTRPILPPLEAYLEHLRDIWTSRQLTNAGPFTAQLERLLRVCLEAAHISLFSNGTMALMTACQALDLSGEVITTPFTFPATPHALTWSRITPVFSDIDPITMTSGLSAFGCAPNAKRQFTMDLTNATCDAKKLQFLYK
jgi:DegT/DnrJ/EryC1/StrS aminotransferase family protein